MLYNPEFNNISIDKYYQERFLRIHLESAKDIYMYISVLINNKFMLTIFYIVYDWQAQNGKMYSSSLVLLLFEMIWNTENQNNEFDNSEQNPCMIRFTQIVNALFTWLNIETLRHFNCSHNFGPRS